MEATLVEVEPGTPRATAVRLVLGGSGAAAGIALAARLGVPLCPFHAVFGLDCPACGATRGTLALLHGDVVGALDHNLLLAVALPLAAAVWLGWLAVALGRPVRTPAPPTRWLPVLVVILTAFTVLRNLPTFAWLGSS